MRSVSLRTLTTALAFIGGYIALILWFAWMDVYRAHFDTPGILVLLQNAFRALFVFYLFFIVQAPGHLLLRLVAGRAYESTPWIDRLLVGFFAGTGLWHVALLALGLAGFYTLPVAIILTVPAVALASPQAAVAFGKLAALRSSDRLTAPFISFGRWQIAATCAVVILTLAVWTELLAVKGLYPGGGHDYYTHYFSYYKEVVASGELGPNEVWYHFYYSKGAGLFFLAMLITDPLAPQLVTFCFISVAALALFRLLERIAPLSLWPWVGLILFLALYIYTPGPLENRNHGGWGDFEKLHEINAALVTGILWLTIVMNEARAEEKRLWAVAAASAATTAILINITISVYLGAIFVALAAWQLTTRQWRTGMLSLALAVVAGVVLLSHLTLNYVATGLPNDQGMLLLWPFADVEKLHRWGALPQLLIIHHGTTGLTANAVPLTFATVKLLARCLRLDLLYPLVAFGALVATLAVARRQAAASANAPTQVLLVATIGFCLLLLAFGRVQPISFYRYASFTLPITIAIGVALWRVPCWPAKSSLRDGYGPVAILVLCTITAALTYSLRSHSLEAVHINAWRFATGVYSIDTAYTTQNGWPGRLPWGGIYSGSRGAYGIVGANTPIRSLHVHSYCMLPGCRMEHHLSIGAISDWDRLMFGSPEEARELLRAAGRNYFLFSRELARDLGMEDVLPMSVLFAPDNIARYLGIRWTDGNTALLTWLGPDTVPLDEAWLTDYQKAVAASRTVQHFPLAAMKSIYQQLRATPHPWHSFKLPW